MREDQRENGEREKEREKERKRERERLLIQGQCFEVRRPKQNQTKEATVR